MPEKFHLLGPRIGNTVSFMQSAGEGYRMVFSRFQSMFVESPPLLRAVHLCTQHDALWLSQLASCHRIHHVLPRLARWLLMLSDRSGTCEMTLKQDLLGNLLGANRTTASIAAATLRCSKCLSYQRGKIVIHDHAALKEMACECYAPMSKLFYSMYSRVCVPRMSKS